MLRQCVPTPLWGMLLLCVFLLTGCSDDDDDLPVEFVVAPGTLEPTEAADAFGPWAVGHQRSEVVDATRDNRRLPYDVWYPVDAADAADEPRTVYPLEGPLVLTAALAVEDLPVSRADPLPLLIFSHGSGGTNTQSVLLMETLASHGFVVVSAEHTGNTNADSSDPREVAGANRIPDVSFIIDSFLGFSEATGDDFFERIDAERIGVLGHSFGGGTAVGSVADGYFGQPADDRVKAAMPISAEVIENFTDEALAAVTEPLLFLGGTLDVPVPIENNAAGFARTPNTAATYQVDIVGATHTHFANICDIANALIDGGLGPDLWPAIGAAALIAPYEETCSETSFPLDVAQRIQNLYAVAFFRRHLNGERDYDFYLKPEYAADNLPDVEYSARTSE